MAGGNNYPMAKIPECGELALVGLGPTSDLKNMPREGYDFLRAIGSSNDPKLRIYANDANMILKDHPILAKARNANLCRDLSLLYQSQQVDPHGMYQYMARAVFRRIKAGYRVVFLAMGNPLLWSTAPLVLRRLCEKEGIPIRIFSSPSFIDLAWEHMDTTCTEGLFVGHATAFATGTIPFVPEASCLLGQLGDNRGMKTGETALYELLQKKLEEKYPPSHRIKIIEGSGETFEMKSTWLRIDQLKEYVTKYTWANLWVPPLEYPA
jgi:uncharacterized protein YabN with tetrapyrrole methylase and pyrophosphatase domain